MPLDLTRDTDGLPRVGRHGVSAEIRCEHCGERLHPEVGGSVAWEPDETDTYLPVAFLHRSCVEGWAERRDADLEEMDLEPFLRALVHNLEAAG